MAYNARPIDILPGIFKEASGYAAQNRWIDGNNVRFWKGFPERIGGNDALTTGLTLCPARGMHIWRALDGSELIAFGHARGQQVMTSGVIYDVGGIAGGPPSIRGKILNASVTCTISNGSPCVVTLTSNPDDAFDEGSGDQRVSIRFTTTGALPTGLSVGTTYYLNQITNTTFNVSSTPSGASINTSSAGSGTHTCTVWAGFTEGEAVTNSAGGSAVAARDSDDEYVYLTADNGTFRVTLSGMSGTFIAGERCTASGSNTTCRVRANDSSSPIDCYEYPTSGGFNGTLTGEVSGASGTITSSLTYWYERPDSKAFKSFAIGGSSGSQVWTWDWTYGGYLDSRDYSGTVLEDAVYASSSQATTWTFASWGEDLISCPRGGKIYHLDTRAFLDGTSSTVTTLSANAPATALGVFMSDVNRTLVAYGAHDGTSDDPLNIAWCDEEDFTTWTPATSNTAGSIRCEDGSEIVGVMPTRGGHLISTDKSIYSFQYIGLPFVFGLQRIAQGPALIGPMSGTEMDGLNYWMGQDSFYVYDGAVRPLVCEVHQYVFSRLNRVQGYKVCCGTVKKFHEVWWFYVSTDATDNEVDSYVAYNTVENTWHIGDKARTSWVDTNVAFNYPVGTKPNGYVNIEEYGVTDDGASIAYTLKSHDIESGDGTPYLHNRMIIPDYERINGTHTVSIEARGWPQRAAVTKGPYDITSSTEFIPVRARGRTLRFSFAGSTDFRMGRFRMRITGHGAKE